MVEEQKRRAPLGRRRILVRVHRWTSWVLVPYVVLMTVTGVVLAIDHDVRNVLQPERTDGSGGVSLPLADIVERADLHLAGQPVLRVERDATRRDVWAVRTQDAEIRPQTLYVDPTTGDPIELTETGDAFHSFVLRLHESINRPVWGPVHGSTIVGGLGIVWLASLGAAGYVWYRPGVQRWRRFFRVRRERGAFAFNMDLHKAVGATTLVILVGLVATGVVLSFRDSLRAPVDAVTPGRFEPRNEIVFSTPGGGEDIGPRVAIESAEAAVGRGAAAAMTLPSGNPLGVYRVSVDVGGFTPLRSIGGGGDFIDVSIDRYSGEVVAAFDERDVAVAQEVFDDWTLGLHEGRPLGAVSRILIAVVGLAAIVLLVSGLRMSLLRRRKRRTALARSSPTADRPTPLDTTEDTERIRT